jgi:hypothetical protein
MVPIRNAHLFVVPNLLLGREELASLTPSDFSRPAAPFGGNWAIEFIVEPNGDSGLVVMPASCEDKDGPTLILWEHEGSYRVDELRWDTYRTIAHCASITEGLVEVRRRVQDETPSYWN